jgi:tRNA pseudouridine13 synthase
MDDLALSVFGAPVLTARLRVHCEDFEVEELHGFEASGSGEHLLLTIEKRGLATTEVAARLARWAGIAQMGVGFAGQKDRNAVARQRFSVHLPKKQSPALETLEGDGLRVLAAAWHARKLPRGALQGNRFGVCLRDLSGARDAIEQRLHALHARGMPNAFGRQRFGRDGDNLAQVRALFSGRNVKMGREKRGMLLSSARSALFNRVLAARIAAGHWEGGLAGEVWMLDGSHSLFGPVPFDEALRARATAHDIHPSGPLWGVGALRSAEDVAELEQAALDDDDSRALRAGLEQAGLRQERRALRVPLAGLAWSWEDAGTALRLHFDLPAGSYATALLDQLGPCEDARGAGATAAE